MQDDDDEPDPRYPEWWALDSERSGPLSDADFDAIANDPVGWSLHSMRFLRAALVVLRDDREHNERSQRRAPGEPRPLALVDTMPVALTLAAVAIENMLKGLIAQAGEAAQNGKLKMRGTTS